MTWNDPIDIINVRKRDDGPDGSSSISSNE